MKLLTSFLLLLSFNVFAAKPKELNLVSYMNFGLAALEVVHLNSGKVRVLIKSAILNYGDDMRNWSQTQDQVKKLKELFEMERIDGLSFTIDERGCGINAHDERIFSCYIVRDTQIEVHAITHDLMGAPGRYELSEKSYIVQNANASLLEVSRRSTRADEKYLEASMGVTLKQNDEFISIYRSKSHLAESNNW